MKSASHDLNLPLLEQAKIQMTSWKNHAVSWALDAAVFIWEANTLLRKWNVMNKRSFPALLEKRQQLQSVSSCYFFSLPGRLPGEARRRFEAVFRLNIRPASGELIFHRKNTLTFGQYFGGWHYMPRGGHIKICWAWSWSCFVAICWQNQVSHHVSDHHSEKAGLFSSGPHYKSWGVSESNPVFTQTIKRIRVF